MEAEAYNLDLVSWLFYLFATIVTFCAVMVIGSRNSVYSVFFLILAFFNAAGLFVLLGVEYLAMTLVIVYVGAVAVLFLFVVMMLNVNFARLRAGFHKYLPLGLLLAVILFAEMGSLFYASMQTDSAMAAISTPIPALEELSNTHAIGQVLYTKYVYLFQLSGLILLIAMIGAIVLTLRHRPGVRRQRIDQQVARKREDSVRLVNVKPGEGA